MISRRDAMKLAAAGFLIPSARVFAETGTPVASPAATPHATDGASQSIRGSWPMAGGNPARSLPFPGPIPCLEEPIIVRWRYQPEDDWIRGNAPVMADGIIYLCGEQNLYAINVDSGLEYWRFETREPRSLALANGVVFTPTSGGLIHAIDVETGLEIWRHSPIVGDGTPEASGGSYYWPTPVGDTLVVLNNSAVEALDASTGTIRWSFPASVWSETALVIDREFVLCSHENNLSAVDLLSGTERWRNTSVMVSLGIVDSVAIGASEGYLSGIDLESGQELWRHTPGDLIMSYATAGSTLIIVKFAEAEFGGYSGEIQAIDSATGNLLWVYSLGDSHGSWDLQTRVVQDQLFLQTRDPENLLLVIDVNTGLKVWEYRGYITSVDPIAVDQMLYFVHDQQLFAIGNLLDPVLISDVTLRAAPAESGIERGTASAGDMIDHVGGRAETNGEIWVEVSVGGVLGWIPASSIDPITLPPEGDIWTLYDPAWF